MTKCCFHGRQPRGESAKNVCDRRDAEKRVLNKRRGGVSDGKPWQEGAKGAVLGGTALSLLRPEGTQHIEVTDPAAHTSSRSGVHTTGSPRPCVSLGYERERMRQKYPVSVPAYLSYSH